MRQVERTRHVVQPTILPTGVLIEANQLLTIEEACQLLRLCRSKLYMLMKQGRLASVKIDGARRIKLASALALIERTSEAQHGA